MRVLHLASLMKLIHLFHVRQPCNDVDHHLDYKRGTLVRFVVCLMHTKQHLRHANHCL